MSTARKTLVFCTSYSGAHAMPWEAWDVRYKRWLEAIRASTLRYDQVLIVDDGSPSLPSWGEVATLSFLPPQQPPEPTVLFHFDNNLGRPSLYDYPGWFRSFTFAATYAQAYGFNKVIHIESDAFLISRRIQYYFNQVNDGWVTFQGHRHDLPESGLQIIAGRGLALFYQVAARPYSEFVGKEIERALPFTLVERGFIGDRFGECMTYVPAEADWTMQTYLPSASSSEYYWWIPRTQLHERKEEEMYYKDIGQELKHDGVYYLDFMNMLSRILNSRTYLEVGTDTGTSLRAVQCDSISIDPDIKISQHVFGGRRRAHFFQMRPDDFFDHYDVRTYFPAGIDLAFLDGLHLFEALLKDFMNAERFCHDRSVILLHDCLPLNHRMAERAYRIDDAEDPSTRDAWTGDVWKLIPILKKYRPDLNIQQFDCGPTGLVVCTQLDQHSRILWDNYDSIIDEFFDISLNNFTLPSLWRQFPTIDTQKIAERAADLVSLLFAR